MDIQTYAAAAQVIRTLKAMLYVVLQYVYVQLGPLASESPVTGGDHDQRHGAFRLRLNIGAAVEPGSPPLALKGSSYTRPR